MKKLFLPFLITLFLLIGMRFFFHNPETTVHSFFNGYGFSLSEKLLESEPVTLPATMTDVYANYNKLQKQAGLDLTPYLGKTVRRYTYQVVHSPQGKTENLRANALVYKNRVIAADVMTVNLDGFMLSPADPYFSQHFQKNNT